MENKLWGFWHRFRVRQRSMAVAGVVLATLVLMGVPPAAFLPSTAAAASVGDYIEYTVVYNSGAGVSNTTTWRYNVTEVDVTKDGVSGCVHIVATISDNPSDNSQRARRTSHSAFGDQTVRLSQAEDWSLTNGRHVHRYSYQSDVPIIGTNSAQIYIESMSGYPGWPYAVGNSWTYNARTDSSNGMAPDWTDTYSASVVADNEVVTAGGVDYICYKVEHTLTATTASTPPGGGVGSKVTEYWPVLDSAFLAPIKVVNNVDFVGTETRTMSSASPLPTQSSPPAVTTGSATSVTSTSATLNGSLTDLGSASSVGVAFQWGTTVAYGSATGTQTLDATGDFNAGISGLTPSTTYHFRAVALGDEFDAGDDVTFTTLPAVSFSSATYSVAEDVLSGTVTITVQLTGASGDTVTVHYATSDGTAEAGSDYTAASGTLTFDPGETSKTFAVTIADDDVIEASETVTLTLSDPANADLGTTSTATLTIVDDDVPDVAFTSATYTGAESDGVVEISVALSAASPGTVTVNYATSDGTAEAGSDYTAASGTLTFNPGETSKSFNVTLTDDDLVEEDETVSLALSNPANANLGAQSTATLTITSEDVPTVAFSSATYSVAENVASGTATITVVLSGTPVQAATVHYATSDGTATAGVDYVAASGTLTFPAGQAPVQVFYVSITDDGDSEPYETIHLALSNPVNLTLASPGTATLTILDNEMPTVSFSSATFSVAENVASGTATITVSLSAPSGDEITVQYATSDGTAEAGSDYTAASGTLTFAAGETSKTFWVSITDDDTVEGDETVALTLSDPVNANLGSQSTATLTIVENDLPELEFSSATYSVAEDVAGGTVTITVLLSPASLGTVAVHYATSDGTAEAGSDYTAASGTLTFAPGQTSKTFTVSITNDDADEASETIVLTLSSPSNAVLGDPDTATLTITDDDLAEVSFSSATYSVAENVASGTATITVTLSIVPADTVEVHYATSDGTAEAGSDYVAASGTLTFAAGETSKTFAITIVNDDTIEANETIGLALSDPVGAALGSPNTATLTIVDNDFPEVAFSEATYSVAENVSSGTVTITVTLSATPAQTVTVQYATSDGTAEAGSDYVAASGTLTFAAGETSKTFSITILDDSTAEADETVNLALSSPVKATLGAQSTAVLTITDTESPVVVTLAATSVGETTAVLNGRLDDLGTAASVAVAFEWGLSTSYGTSRAVSTMSGTGTFSLTVTGLSSGMTYHFRARASGDGTGYGTDRTFTTIDGGPMIYPTYASEPAGAEEEPAPSPEPTAEPEPTPEPSEESPASPQPEAAPEESPLAPSPTGEGEEVPPAPSYPPPATPSGMVLFGDAVDGHGRAVEPIVVASDDGTVMVQIPEGTRGQDASGNPLLGIITRTDVSAPDEGPDGPTVISVVDFGPDGAVFDGPITVTLSYDPNGLPEGVAAEDLMIAYYDEVTGAWVPLDNIQVDTVNHTVSGTVNHFTLFAILIPVVSVAENVSSEQSPGVGPGAETASESSSAEGEESEPAVLPMSEEEGGQGTNVWVIVGPIIGVVLAGAVLWMWMRRRGAVKVKA